MKEKFDQLVAKDKHDYEFEELMLSMRIISEVDRLLEENNMQKKDLAKALGTSAAYVTQLFSGNKILNLYTVARLQEIFDVDFRINSESRAVKTDELMSDSFFNFTVEQDASNLDIAEYAFTNGEYIKGNHLKVVTKQLEAA